MALVGDWKSQHFLWCRQMPRFLSSPPLPQPPPPTFLIIWTFWSAQFVCYHSDSRLVLSCSTGYLQSAQTFFLQGRALPPCLGSRVLGRLWQPVASGRTFHFQALEIPCGRILGFSWSVRTWKWHWTPLDLCSTIPFYLPEPVLLIRKWEAQL